MDGVTFVTFRHGIVCRRSPPRLDLFAMDVVTFVTFRAAIGPSPGHHANEKGRPRMGTPFRKPVGTKRSGAA
jgi:hypothetical protein